MVYQNFFQLWTHSKNDVVTFCQSGTKLLQTKQKWHKSVIPQCLSYENNFSKQLTLYKCNLQKKEMLPLWLFSCTEAIAILEAAKWFARSKFFVHISKHMVTNEGKYPHWVHDWQRVFVHCCSLLMLTNIFYNSAERWAMTAASMENLSTNRGWYGYPTSPPRTWFLSSLFAHRITV